MPTAASALPVDDLLARVPEGERRSLAQAVLQRSVPVLRRLLEKAPADVLIDSLSAPSDVGTLARLLSGLAGAEQAIGEIDPLAEAFARGAEIKQELLWEAGGGWSVSQVARHLQLSRQAIDKRRRRGSLLAVEVGGEHLYPAFQFTEDGTVPGLQDLLHTFAVESPWTMLSVLLSETPRAPGLRVIDALAQGDVEAARHAARTYGEQGAL